MEETGVGEWMASPEPGKMSSFVEHCVERVVVPVGPASPIKEKQNDDAPPALKKLKPQSSNNSNCSTSSSSSGSSSSGPALVCSPAPPPLTPQVPQPPNLHVLPPSTPPPLPSTIPGFVDVCVGTSVETITEQDYPGLCEPGTSVILKGIVWNEAEGVLVVNVTWRGKTYMGALLDFTKHDWGPSRFFISPTSDLDIGTLRDRIKRGQSAGNALLNDLTNLTEASSVQSKLQSIFAVGPKGSTGPVVARPRPFAASKSEAKSSKRKNTTKKKKSLSKQKKTPSQPANKPLPTPVLLDCPEPNCKKKYKLISRLKYHLSHVHGSPDVEETKEYPTFQEQDASHILKESLSKQKKTPSQPANKHLLPPVLLDCPEPNCKKKYKLISRLKYHLSHVHGSPGVEETKEYPTFQEQDPSHILDIKKSESNDL